MGFFVKEFQCNIGVLLYVFQVVFEVYVKSDRAQMRLNKDVKVLPRKYI